MRRALILVKDIPAGLLEETDQLHYLFTYDPNYVGEPVSLTMPIAESKFEYKKFPPFFEGLLPEGVLLDALLKKHKLDRNDYFGQLLKVGNDLVGSVTVREIK